MSKDSPKYPAIPDPSKVLDVEARLNRNTQLGPEGYTQWVQMPDGSYVQMQGMSPTTQALRNAQLSAISAPLYEGDPLAGMSLPAYANPIAPEGASSTFLPLDELDAINKRLRYDTNATDQASQDQGSGGTDSSGGPVSLGTGPMALNSDYWNYLGGALGNIGAGMDKSKISPNINMPEMNFSNPINITNPIGGAVGGAGGVGSVGGRAGGSTDIGAKAGEILNPGGIITNPMPNVLTGGASDISVGNIIPKIGDAIGGVTQLPTTNLGGSKNSNIPNLGNFNLPSIPRFRF